MTKNDFINIALSIGVASTLSTYAYSADLNSTSIQPKITFIDSNHNSGNNTHVWELKQTEASGFDYFYLRNILDDNKIISISRLQDGTSPQGGSMVVTSSGDLSFAGGSVFIDRSTQSLNIGTHFGDAALNIKGTSDIVLDNDTTAWRISNIDDWLTFGPSLKNRYVFNMSPHAPLYSFNITDNGFIGIGNSNPQARVDVQGNMIINGDLNVTSPVTAAFTGATTKQALKMLDISVNNTNLAKKSDVGFSMTNARGDGMGGDPFTWTFRTWEPDSGFAIAKYGNGATKELRLYDTDPTDATTVVLELANGASNTGGQWLDASSRAYKENIKELDTQTAMEAFSQLKPVTYNYKTNKSEGIVGFIAEDVPDVVATNSRDALSALEMVALLTKVVQAKDIQMEEMSQKQKIQEEKMEKMESMLHTLMQNTKEKQ